MKKTTVKAILSVNRATIQNHVEVMVVLSIKNNGIPRNVKEWIVSIMPTEKKAAARNIGN
jgi:hypothetical protein